MISHDVRVPELRFEHLDRGFCAVVKCEDRVVERCFWMNGERTLESIRKAVLDAAQELRVDTEVVARWMERAYRVYLDFGGHKVR